MKKSIIIIIITIIIILLIVSSLVVFAGNTNKQLTLEEKVSEEIEYLDKYLVSLLGDFNNLTIGSYLKEKKSSNIQMESQQSTQQNSIQENTSNNKNKDSQTKNTSKNTIDISQNNILENKGKYDTQWNTIQNQIEELYSVWNTISIDLHSLNVNGNLILAFSDFLNISTQSIKKEEKEKSLEATVKLYQLLPQYSQDFRKDTKETNLLKIQSNIVTAYVYVSNEKWQEAQTQLANASKQFTNLLNSVNQNFSNQTTVNQCYVLINELNNAVKLKDKEIFFIQYQNLMGKMEVI